MSHFVAGCTDTLTLDLEEREPFVRMIQPEEAWLYRCSKKGTVSSLQLCPPVLSSRNPMTESYVSGRWLWRMVVLVPVLTVGGVYAVSGGWRAINVCWWFCFGGPPLVEGGFVVVSCAILVVFWWMSTCLFTRL